MATPTQPAPQHLDALDILLGGSLCLWVTMILFILGFVQIPKENQTLFGSIATGGIVALLTTLINNRWGAAKSGQTKDATISAIATTKVDGGT